MNSFFLEVFETVEGVTLQVAASAGVEEGAACRR